MAGETGHSQGQIAHLSLPPPPKKEFPDVLRVGGTGEALTRRVVPWEMEGSSYLSPSHCEILSC